ncbi:MAG: ABC transporter ATP-binding protein [Actinomycetaceae bacterium]|nr:ABC transporter ATP-binding protein [Actinomycetaceae bacterium]
MTTLHKLTSVSNPVVIVRNLTKTFGRGDHQVVALNDVSIDIERGSFTVIMGPSGSGKSTFMHCVAGLDSVTKGSIDVDGIRITDMSQRRLTKMRRDHIGFVFQSFNLIPTLNAAENITLPRNIAHKKVDEKLFDAVVDSLDLTHRLTHKPAELSGGQQQRVACARALVQEPAVLFADEPTGNLDSTSSQQVLRYLRQAVDKFGQTVVMVTHEPDAAAWADKILFLKDGRLVAELQQPTRTSVLNALGELEDIDAEEPGDVLKNERYSTGSQYDLSAKTPAKPLERRAASRLTQRRETPPEPSGTPAEVVSHEVPIAEAAQSKTMNTSPAPVPPLPGVTHSAQPASRAQHEFSQHQQVSSFLPVERQSVEGKNSPNGSHLASPSPLRGADMQQAPPKEGRFPSRRRRRQ